jgi:hypothetical protein
LSSDEFSNKQKAQMGTNLFNTLLDYGMKYTMQQNEIASRERIAGMRSAGQASENPTTPPSFSR